MAKQAASSKSKTPKAKILTYPCLLFKQGGQQLVCFVASAKAIAAIVDVNRREADPDGYQRAASASRTNKIARFIEGGHLIPNSVLIAFDKATVSSTGKSIEIPNKAHSGWIIDGQHRLIGASKSKQDIDIPVIAPLNLDLKGQIHCFVTINREHKGVPSSLYLELLKQLPGGLKDESDLLKERASDLADLLRKDENSPFFGKIVSVTSPKEGELSLTNFVRKIVPLIRRSGRFAIYSDEERAGIISNAYTGLEHAFPKEYRRSDSVFFRTVGFGAIMNTLPQLMDICLQQHHGFRVEDVTKTFKEIEDFNFEAWREMGTGTAAENMASEDLKTELEESFKHGTQASKTLKLS